MNDTTHWDAIVIGSGLGGLAAAAAFANKGKRVLVLERLANFGGAATVYRRGALTMEGSLHETDGDTVFGPNSVFARLGLTGAVETIKIDVFYQARGGALAVPIQIPPGLDAMFGMSAVFAEYERAMTIERINAGLLVALAPLAPDQGSPLAARACRTRSGKLRSLPCVVVRA
jgi:FAD binding domain